jgi:hypothetical protein
MASKGLTFVAGCLLNAAGGATDHSDVKHCITIAESSVCSRRKVVVCYCSIS